MFVTTIPPLSLKKSIYHHSIVASRKRPVLYVDYDETLFEVSLVTGESYKIIDLPSCYDSTLACNESDVIFMRRWSPNGIYFHRISQASTGWKIEDLSGCQECGSVQYCYENFSPTMNKWESEENRSYVDGSKFRYWDGSVWRIYNIIGKLKTVLAHNMPCHLHTGFFRCINSDTYLVYFRRSKTTAQMWIARNEQMTMIWEQGYAEPPMLTYSALSNKIYGISLEWESTHENPIYISRPTSLTISVYQFECISLFNQCIRVIRQYPHLDEHVPVYLREKVDYPVTERFLKQKEFADKDLTDAELRDRYCLI